MPSPSPSGDVLAAANDLALFWASSEGCVLPAAAARRALAQVARRPLAERVPALAVLGPYLAHEDAEVRAASLRVLAGARSREAFARLIAGCEDPCPTVRDAAFDAFEESARNQPLRWAHLLVHPDAEVRRGALARDLPRATRSLQFVLLADPATRAQVAPEATASPTTLLEAHAKGWIDAPRVWNGITDLSSDAFVDWVRDTCARRAEEIETTLASAGREAPGRDRLDDLLDTMRAGEPPAALYEQLSRLTVDDRVGRRFHRRVSAAMHRRLHLDHVEGRTDARLLLLACRLDAAALLDERFAPEARRSCLRGLVRQRRGHLDDALTKRLLASPLGATFDAAVDIALLAQASSYAVLTDALGEDALVAAFAEDLEAAGRLVSDPGLGRRDRRWFLARLERRGHGALGETLALLEATVSDLALSERVAKLPRLDAPMLCRIAQERALPIKRLRRLVGAIAERRHVTYPVLDAWLGLPAPEENALGRLLLGRFARGETTPNFVRWARTRPTPALQALLRAIPFATTFPYGKERALAEELRHHAVAEARAWAEERLGRVEPPPPPPSTEVHPLSDAEQRAIAGGSRPKARRSIGLCEALRRRAPAPDAAICEALLLSHDPLTEVAPLFESYLPARLDDIQLQDWIPRLEMPAAGHAWLHRWEAHAIALLRMFGGDAARLIEIAIALPSPSLAAAFLGALARALGVLRYHDRPRAERIATARMVAALVPLLETEHGPAAARTLRVVHEGSLAPGAIEAQHPHIRSALPRMTNRTRDELRSLVRADGLPPRHVAATRATDAHARRAQIARSDDLELLAEACRSAWRDLAETAALRLLELGPAGEHRLLQLVREGVPAAARASILLPDELLARARAMIADEDLPVATRFRLALAHEQREQALVLALEPLPDEGAPSFVEPADGAELRAHAGEGWAERLATSPHPELYVPAVDALCERRPSPAARAALRRFLLATGSRALSQRWNAARALWRNGDPLGVPLLFALVAAETTGLAKDAGAETFPLGGRGELAPSLVDGVLWTGIGRLETKAMKIVRDAEADTKEVLGACLMRGTADTTRRAAAERLSERREPGADRRVQVLAETFAWGVRIARALSGRLYRIRLTYGDSLGYTYLDGRALFVSAEPVLAGVRYGREMVEGLILHELGHHLHHAGPGDSAVWAQADREGLGWVLNLVADEHLERNLRANDESHGRRLGRLCAWAFMKRAQTIPIPSLLQILRLDAFEVLTQTDLAPARRGDAVVVPSGALMHRLEATGASFARFFRALRMGLGNRHGDPRVERALALFDRRFRHRTMPELLDTARELRAIFGEGCALAGQLGSLESIDPGDGLPCSGGLGDEEVWREVERILAPPATTARPERPKPGPAVINVGPDTTFPQIRYVVPARPDPEEHRRLAAEVRGPAHRLRHDLSALGLASVRRPRRVRGRQLDRGRLPDLVLRGDPRVLIGRERKPASDLFLGVAIDCSGSMTGRSMDLARRFGVLLAEATRGLPGVDLRVIGFEHDRLHDAGDAAHCAVTGLHARGGNNDAAGLWHVAELARRSGRSGKLLVMISDGLPTECSTTALRGLVQRLGREGFACAQVAVRPLEEQCFEHYVEIPDLELGVATQRFGHIVSRLVRATQSRN